MQVYCLPLRSTFVCRWLGQLIFSVPLWILRPSRMIEKCIWGSLLRPAWPRLASPAHNITKTCLYNTEPLKPHFYILKLGLTGVYIIFLISAQKHRLWYSLEPPCRGGSNEYIDAQKHRLWYSLEPPCRGGSNEYPQSMFWAKFWKISEFFIWKFSFFRGKIFYIFELACFRNDLLFSVFMNVITALKDYWL